MVTHQFDPYDFQGVKEFILSLVDQAKSFKVKYVVDTNNRPYEWKIEVE